MPIEYDPREDLIARAEALSGGADDVDPEVLARAQEALARDLAFFGALSPGGSENAQLIALWRSGEIEAGDEALQAAAFLHALLAEGAG